MVWVTFMGSSEMGVIIMQLDLEVPFDDNQIAIMAHGELSSV